MAVRNIVRIDEEKCNGCGKCITACAEGALKIVNGKAKLIRDDYCDGLGACLGSCPQNAIIIEQREANEFDEAAVEKHLSEASQENKPTGFMCPSMMAKKINSANDSNSDKNISGRSELKNWPVQLMLMPTKADYLENAELLFAADCVAFSMGAFHQDMLKGKVLAIACPKLDDKNYYVNKLADIFRNNKIKSLTVVHMQVPCCSGMTWIVDQARKAAGVDLVFTDITISLEGEILDEKKI